MTIIHTSNTEQPGGWFSVQVITLPELTSCPAILTNSNASSIEVTGANETIDVLPVGETIRIGESSKWTHAGLIHNIKVDFEFAKQSSALDVFLSRLQFKKVVIIGTKHDGQKKIYGSKISPLTFSYNHVNGRKLEDGSKISITIEGATTQKPVYIND